MNPVSQYADFKCDEFLNHNAKAETRISERLEELHRFSRSWP